MSRAQGAWSLLLLALFAAPTQGQSKTAKSEEAPPAVVRFQLNSEPYVFKITKVNPDGHLEVTPADTGPGGPRQLPGLTEGYFLGITTKDQKLQSLVGSMASLTQVVRVEEGGAAVVRVGPAAAKALTDEHTLVMIRPVGSSTAAIKSIPLYAPIEDTTAVAGGLNAEEMAKYIATINNLKQIGLALHNYHDAYNGFPPAVVYGPDGKPWHSWRVLILTFPEEIRLFDKYKMDEPWDSPHNKKLCDVEMAIYQAPVFGESNAKFTSIVAAVGEDTTLVNQKDKSKKRRFGDIRDGSSNTIMAGVVGPETKIPWSMPQDMVFDAKFPPIGKKGGFATPYKSAQGPAGPFLLADGSVRTISATIKPDIFRNLLTIADGAALNYEEDVPMADLGGNGGRGGGPPEIHVVRTADGVKVRLVAAER